MTVDGFPRMNEVVAMSDPIAEFFTGLPDRGHDPWLGRNNGSVRFDLEGSGPGNGDATDRWLVSIADGAFTVQHDGVKADTEADAVIQADRRIFGRIVAGEVNATTALLRGAIHVDGHPGLLVRFRRLFAGPPSAVGPARPTARADAAVMA
jgi:hypothetical protein